MAASFAEGSKKSWPTTSDKKTGGLLSQAARNQTQGEEARYAKGTTHSSRRKGGLFACAVIAQAEGGTLSGFTEKRVVVMPP